MGKGGRGERAMLGRTLVKLKPLRGFGLLLPNESLEKRRVVVRFRF